MASSDDSESLSSPPPLPPVRPTLVAEEEVAAEAPPAPEDEVLACRELLDLAAGRCGVEGFLAAGGAVILVSVVAAGSARSGAAGGFPRAVCRGLRASVGGPPT